jgi:arylsulfatase A-like enzyme
MTDRPNILPLFTDQQRFDTIGQYPWNSGCADNGFPMPLDGPSMQSLLADAGYRTHSVGKRHFSPDRWASQGFQSMDTQEEIPGSEPEDDYTKWLWSSGWEHAMEPHGVRSEMYYVPQVNLLLGWVQSQECSDDDRRAKENQRVRFVSGELRKCRKKATDLGAVNQFSTDA